MGGRCRKGQNSQPVGGPPLDAGVAVIAQIRVAPPPSTEVELRDAADHVMRMAPPPLRLALQLRYWEDWPVQDIASRLGVDRHALARDLCKFLGRMRSDLGADEDLRHDSLAAASRFRARPPKR